MHAELIVITYYIYIYRFILLCRKKIMTSLLIVKYLCSMYFTASPRMVLSLNDDNFAITDSSSNKLRTENAHE